MNELPFTPSEAFQSITTILGEDQVTIDAHWNTRDEAWYMHLTDANGNPIAKGIKLVLGVPLGRGSAHEFFSKHLLKVWDTSGEDREATLDDLGTRVVVLHATAAELSGVDQGTASL